MANYPQSAVKKFTKPAHREIAVGIVLAYGLFPRTNDGVEKAKRFIASRTTWLAPSELPNYYDEIESDLMTGKETAGIVNIRMILREFYGIPEERDKVIPVEIVKPSNKKETKPTKKEPTTGETQIYKPEDKFVDDVTEKLDKKLEEKSDQILDVVDELIAQQKQAFEDFKRKQQEELEARRKARESANPDQYPKPAGPVEPPVQGPDPMQGPAEPPVQGPKEPPKKTVAPENDEDWESEVPDQLGTKLDELIEQVKNDPLPQPTAKKRRRTRGKSKKLGRKMPRITPSEMGIGESLSEIYQNVIETRQALFNLYKINKERFEFKKSADAKLTQLLKGKAREAALEAEPKEETEGKGKSKDKDKKKKKKDKKQGLLTTMFYAGLAGILAPLILRSVSPFFNKEEEQPPEAPVEETPSEEQPPEIPEAPAPAPEAPAEAPAPAPEAPAPTPLPDTSIPGDYDYKGPALPLKAAATGGEFFKGDKKPLAPIQKSETQNPAVKKLTKPLLDVVTLPQKAGAITLLSLANKILSPFAPLIPGPAKEFINNMFGGIAKAAGIPNFRVELGAEKNIFDAIMGMFGGGDNKNGNSAGGGGGGGAGGGGSSAGGDDLKSFIGGLESGNDYTKLVGGAKDASILDKTIAQLSAEKGDKFAMGRYQIQMASAKDMLKARGIDPTTFKFDQAGQDQIFQMLLDRRGYQDFKSGKMSKEDFAKNLSMEWAALPTDASGRGFYDNVGTNKSLTSWDNTLKALEKDKNEVPPAPPPSGDDALKPPAQKPPIEKGKTFQDQVVETLGLAQKASLMTSPVTAVPAAASMMSDIFKLNSSNNSSSSSESSKNKASQPGL